MNQTYKLLMDRKSIRAYTDEKISEEVKSKILACTMRAPTAGNMMLYSILDITDQAIKEILVKTCDNQPFIARAPMVWIFLADYQRWFEYFLHSGVMELCDKKNIPFRTPEEGDLFLACCDALIAAQNAAIAAESFGLGSCYIGDIMENYEVHKDLFDLPQYTFPICMLVFGYPTEQQKERDKTSRIHKDYLFFENKYRKLTSQAFESMYQDRQIPRGRKAEDYNSFGQLMYFRKFSSDFSIEMSRSVRAMIDVWNQKS
jgi:FMN reductase (NADPH)/FMN reductase [NAD(P)H]